MHYLNFISTRYNLARPYFSKLAKKLLFLKR